MLKKPFILTFILILLVTLVCGCNQSEGKFDGNIEVLRIYNCQDYIDDGLDDDGNVISNSILDDWVIDYKARTGKNVSYMYETFETNENMYNVLKTGKATYDLVVPSDYMIQKMMRENMLEEFHMEDDGSYTNVPNYNDYGSNYLKELFDEYNFTKYTIPYMWGTMGFVYDPSVVSEEDISSWNVLWDEKYHNASTVKNSVRDTYVVGVMHVYQNELNELRTALENNLLTEAISDEEKALLKKNYNDKVNEIMNRVDDETISLVQDDLISLRQNIFGFEVDNGKTDIVTGKIHINFAWSGDAVYSMDCAEEDADMKLNYYVPLEGSNVWFDAWVMPKGANVELAEDFVNYLSSPESAIRNMDKIGYTSSIAGDDVFNYMLENYEAEEDGIPVDVTYFYKDSLSEELLTDGRAIINVEERGRQFDAQYPDEETILRCGIMQDFGDRNDAVLNMWENVRSGASTLLLWLPIILIVLFALGFYIAKQIIKNERKKRHMALKN